MNRIRQRGRALRGAVVAGVIAAGALAGVTLMGRGGAEASRPEESVADPAAPAPAREVAPPAAPAVPAPAAPAAEAGSLGNDDPAWAAQTEEALRGMAARLGPEARLDSVVCRAGSCRLELTNELSDAAGQKLQGLIRDATEMLPDSVLQPDGQAGKTTITLARSPDATPRLARRDHEDSRSGRLLR